MVGEKDWISTAEFAEAAGITPQAARKALGLCIKGGRWRGHAIVVRRRPGAGGRAGLSYEVALASLPGGLRRAEQTDESPAVAGEMFASTYRRPSQAIVVDRLQIITRALNVPAQSQERARAIAQAASNAGVTVRTLYRWIDRFERQGVGGLARVPSRTASQPRVVVSRAFDEAFRSKGYTQDQLDKAGEALGKALKGLWASRAEAAGATEVRRLAEYLLLEHCESHGITLPKEAFRVSGRTVARFAHYRVVNQRRNDRKAFDDAKPRISRDWTGLAPMERIVADVKHLDVIVSRPDGTPAWPKIVAFMDAGTGRVFVRPVLLDPGEGVRQEHVIEAFLAMVSQPDWGFPQSLYLDNGSEFGALEKIDSALRLMNDPGARTVIYALPYNASAKPIEGLFARLDRYVFSLFPGYAGGNRMAKKTQRVGKPPKPYPGSWDEFCLKLQGLIGAHNLRPVGGQWRGRSPQQWLEDKVAQGWRGATVAPCSLDSAFADHDSRRVDRGVLRIRGQRFAHPDLAALPSRTVVDLALPWRRDAAPLARISDRWVSLEREQLYPAQWVEGAKESARRQKAQTRYVSALARSAPAIDPIETKIRWAQRISSAPATTGGLKLDLGDQLKELGQAVLTAGALPSATISPAAVRRARDLVMTERLERRQKEQT